MTAMMNTRHVLVTGGAGFIGSHVVERLLDGGHRVRIVDDLSTGMPENVPSGVDFVHADVTDGGVWHRVLEGMDAVVHLAAIASVARSVEDPVATHAVNALATIELGRAMVDRGVERIVYASTSAVYGDHDPGEGGLPESSTPRPLTPYAIDKLSGEHYLAFLARTSTVRVTSLRFFNVYGPRQDPSSPYSGVIGIFARRILDGRPLVVHGDGLQTRDFVYVGDVARVVVDATLAPSRDGPAWGDGRPVNVGTGHRSTLLDLIAALSHATGRRPTVDHGPERPGDVRRSWADVSRLQSLHGSSPRTPLEAGLAATLDWLR